ncbi:MAG TPA: winged helix DNA-binding domain-containing protein [Acidimicrobiia bacterium]|jgi:hypothetical protein
MTAPVLTDRALSRATLKRQFLLERVRLDPLQAAEALAGLQAQSPSDPYLGLWARLDDFDPAVLSRHIEQGSAVRAQLMRATIHLVSAADYPLFAGATRNVLARVYRSTPFAKALNGVDLDRVLDVSRQALREQPLTRAQLARLLAEEFPGIDPPSMAQAATYLIPVVQVPPRGLWQKAGAARWALATDWLGREPSAEARIDELMLRYLAAFGPATVADARTWSNLTGLAEVFERLRPQLVVFRDERGRELFDLPDAPRPDPDTEAPVRFLPEYDNVLLSHADRSRIAGPVEVEWWVGWILVDGFLAGTWKHKQTGRRLELSVRVATPNRRSIREVEEEAGRLAAFLAKPDSDHDVTVETVTGSSR